MITLLESLGAGKGTFLENGQFFALFLLALLFLWLTEEKAKKVLLIFGVITVAVLLCPFTAKLLIKYQTGFYAWEHIWTLVPLTVFVAYVLTLAADKLWRALLLKEKQNRQGNNLKKRGWYEAGIAVILVGVLFFGGTVTLAETVTSKTGRWDGLPEEVGEVLDLLVILEEEQVSLAAPDEVSKWCRIYSGNIVLPYGRDMIETELTAYIYDKYTSDVVGLHDWIEGSLPAPALVEEAYLQEEAYVEFCAAAGIEYLIFTTERANQEVLIHALENSGVYEAFAKTSEYVIYCR